MFENVFILILNTSMSAIGTVSFDFSICYTFSWNLTLLYYSAIFVGGVQGSVLSPGAGYPRYATDTHTTGFWKCALCSYIELSKPSLPADYQEKMKESRKVLSPKDNKRTCRLFHTLTCWTPKRKSVNTH